MPDYIKIRKRKLAEYKCANLTTDSGKYKGRTLQHILPKLDKYLNILDTFRDDFWRYYDTIRISLHPYFHHLNSSQALCFNLFFPLCQGNLNYLTYALLRIIEVDPAQQIPFSKFEEVLEIKDSVLSDKRANELDEEFLNMNKPLHWEFEKVLDASEGTNFDYYVEMPKSHRVLFEVKYTEAKFSEEKPDETHIKKYLKFYRPKLSGIFKPEFLNQDTILKNYQIARNLSYIDEQTTVVFLFPEQNEKLNATENFINSVVYQDKLKHIRIIYLEHFIEQLLQSEYLLSKHKIFEEFKAKYIT